MLAEFTWKKLSEISHDIEGTKDKILKLNQI